jgi:NIMA (never in mitosis gene a)-related kinase
LNEVRILASLNIPQVLAYRDSFFEPASQSLCLVMEYAEGGDL